MTTIELIPASARPVPACWDELSLALPGAAMTVVVALDAEATVVGLRFGLASDHAAWLGDARRDPEAVRPVAVQLQAYAAGTAESFEIPLRLSGSEFQLEVWAELLRIPYGATTTYGTVADAIGRPGRARAVGTAVGSNPVGIIVPCHRVIGANGSLTGFAGGLANKTALLAREGITAF